MSPISNSSPNFEAIHQKMSSTPSTSSTPPFDVDVDKLYAEKALSRIAVNAMLKCTRTELTSAKKLCKHKVTHYAMSPVGTWHKHGCLSYPVSAKELRLKLMSIASQKDSKPDSNNPTTSNS